MNPITDKSWLDDHQWGVCGFNAEGKIHTGAPRYSDNIKFKLQCPPPGEWVNCPDRTGGAEFKGRFLLQTVKHNGSGFCNGTPEIVEHEGQAIALGVCGDRAEVQRLRRIACTDEVLDEALRRCGYRVVRGGEVACSANERIVMFGGRLTVNAKGQGHHYGKGELIVGDWGDGCHYGDGVMIVRPGGRGRHWGKGEGIVLGGGGGWRYDADQGRVRGGGEGWHHGKGSLTVRCGGHGGHYGEGDLVVEGGADGDHHGGGDLILHENATGHHYGTGGKGAADRI